MVGKNGWELVGERGDVTRDGGTWRSVLARLLSHLGDMKWRNEYFRDEKSDVSDVCESLCKHLFAGRLDDSGS